MSSPFDLRPLVLLLAALPPLSCGSSDPAAADDEDTDATGDSTGTSPMTTTVAVDDEGSDDAPDSTASDGADTEGSPCGNGVVDDGEVCDDGVNDGSYGGCAPGCSELAPYCGDGSVNGGTEVCDDGINDGAYDGCTPDCTARAPYCGDAITTDGESCDDGNGEIDDGCNPDCTESGQTLWETSWTSYDRTMLPMPGYQQVPAGLEFHSAGRLQLATTEYIDYEPTGWSLRLDSDTGEIVEDHQVPAVRFQATARRGAGMLVVGSTDTQAEVFVVSSDGVIADTYADDPVLGLAIAVAPNDDDYAAVYGGPAQLKAYSDSHEQLFQYTSSYVDLRAVVWNEDGVISGADASFGHLGLHRHDTDGIIVENGFWGPADPSGSLLFAGMEGGTDGGVLAFGRWEPDPFVVKFDASLEVAWELHYGDFDDNLFAWTDACATPTGDWILAGSQSGSGDSVYLWKLDATGESIWDRVLDGYTRVTRVACDDDGGGFLATSDADTLVGSIMRFAP